jgi:hypothetical protein
MANFSQPLLGAGAEAKNDWAHASAETGVTFTGFGEIRRGFEIEIGINALANADAGLRKFIDANVRGNAFAEAKASLRCQLPLNLFKDFGIVIGAQAVAQAAAGIQVGLGLAIDDFIALLRQNPESAGIPIDLVLVLLDEATIGGNFEVHVAASAMAYASIQIAGEIVENPGFHVLVDAGLGLAAGVGFSGGLDLGIQNFRRFYGRAVDLTVDSVIEGLAPTLSRSQPQLLPVLQALSPASKMSLRIAYEVGDYIAKNKPAPNQQGALDLSNHCVGILLEEAQRFLFGKFLEAGLRSLERLVLEDVPTLSAVVWQQLRPQRVALANVLFRMPADAFQPTNENASYWAELITSALDLVARLATPLGNKVTRGLAMTFATTSLLMEATEHRVNVAQSYAFAIGAGRVTTPRPSFTGSLHKPAPQKIRAHINQVLGRGEDHGLDYADLIAYLASDAIITTLRETLPAVDGYLAIFQHPSVASNLTDVLRTLLRNGGAFVVKDGQIDPQETLRVLLGGLNTFMTGKIQQELVPAVNQHIRDPNTNLYFNEVIVGTLLFTKDLTFQSVLGWQLHPVDKDAFTEALAGIMTMMLGRSLVLVGDGFMSALQDDMQRACAYAASRIESQKDPFRAMGVTASPELKALIADTLRIGGEVFGPLPKDARRRIRFVLYDVMETLPPDAAEQADFLTNLSDQFFLPNEESVNELKEELFRVSQERFGLFLEKVLQAGAELIVDAFEEFIREMIEAIGKWVEELDKAIQGLLKEIAELERQIQQMVLQAQQELEQAMDDLDTLLETFANNNMRNHLRVEVADAFYQDAKSILADDFIYQSLSRRTRRFIRSVLGDTIRAVIEGPVMDPIFNAIGSISGELDSIVDDARELDMSRPLEPQLLDLIVDRMEDTIRDAFGATRPKIEVGFSVVVPFIGSYFFGLGKVDLPFGTLFNILRESIDTLDFYESQLADTAAALRKAFLTTIVLEAKRDTRANKHAEHAKRQRIRAEFISSPKTVTILNPVQSLVYEGDVNVEIHLGNVPASYLGVEEYEQPRVLILLNGNLIPPESLILDDPFASFDDPKLQGPFNFRAVFESTQGGGVITGNQSAVSFSLLADVPEIAAKSPFVHVPSLKPILRAPGFGRDGISSQPVQLRSARSSPKRLAVTTTSVTNITPGRRMTITKRSHLLQTLPPGLTLKFCADRAHLDPGINTLAVIVIDPGGHRYQQVVSFSVTKDAKETLPAHFDRKSVTNRLNDARKFMTKRGMTRRLRDIPLPARDDDKKQVS